MSNQRLRHIIAESLELPVETISQDASTSTLEAWDSLAHLRIVLAVEQAYGVKFDTSEIPELVSVPQLEEALRQRNAL